LLLDAKFFTTHFVELKSTWLQNPKTHKNAVASQEVCRFFVWVSVYDNGYKIKMLYHLVG